MLLTDLVEQFVGAVGQYPCLSGKDDPAIRNQVLQQLALECSTVYCIIELVEFLGDARTHGLEILVRLVRRDALHRYRA